MYLQSIHLTRLVSRLTRVKPQQSEWLFTELFSAECGSSLKPCRVGSAELNVPPVILLGTAHLAAALPQVVDEAPQQHRVGLGLVARPGHVASTLTLGAYFYTNCSLMEQVSISVWYSSLGISADLHENVTNNSVSGFLDNKDISVYCILILIHQNDTTPNTVSISLKGTSCVDNCAYNLV